MNNINFLSEIADFIFVSKYARYNPWAERRETWDECIDRVETMHLQKFKKLDKEDTMEIKWAFQQVRDKKVTPSMRSMQFGGKAIIAHNSRLFNCGKITTKFVTSHGVKSFEDYEDGSEITVLTHKGGWKPATVRKLGRQKLNKITLKRCKKNFVEYFTSDHRWILRDGAITTNLKCGDLLRSSEDIFSKFDYDTANGFERLYWAYGFVYGDGTRIQDINGNNKYSMVRLCGEGKQKYLYRFEELGFSSSKPLSCHEDAIVYTGTYLKTAPNPEIDSPELIRAFVAGYLAADGAKNNNNSGNFCNSIQSSELDHIEFIRKCFPIAGVFILSEQELTGQVTNFGVRPYTIRFSIYDTPNNKENSNTCFKVIDITEDKEEEVWCLEVEEDMSFVLPSGLVTGNCAVRHIDSIRSFSESFYLLLCGCGVGFGLSNYFLDRLPKLVTDKDKTGTVITYVIEDSIEGWADSIEALLNCFFRNTAYTGRKIIFDYSRIRPEGAPLKTGGGKAPGYKGLKNAHKKIKVLLDHIIEQKKQLRLSTLNAYDVLMHCADAVLSGGIRRSACSVIFDKNDTDMLNAKTFFHVTKHTKFEFNEASNKLEGKVTVNNEKYEVAITQGEYDLLVKDNTISWVHIEPQRARSNNSVLLLRDKTSFEEFKAIVEKTKQFGEPGFVWAEHPHQLFNPCQPAWAKLLTKQGIKELKDVAIGEEIWSKEGWTHVTAKWSTGTKPVYRYRTSAGVFYGTDTHKVVSNGEKVEVKDCEGIDIFAGPSLTAPLVLDPQDTMDGLIIGDGYVYKASNHLVYLGIGKNDQDYFNSEVQSLITCKRLGLHEGAYEVTTTIKAEELALTYDREIPDRFYYGTKEKIAGFLRGLYSANGSICATRITLKAPSLKIIERVQTMLSALGIRSYYTTNKPTMVHFDNGDWLCKQSYDLNIMAGRKEFYQYIGFIQDYKTEKLKRLQSIEITNTSSPKHYSVLASQVISTEEVFDLTVDNNSHTYWTQGCDVSNCFEIGFIPVTDDGCCGVQFCNLSSINGAKIKNKEDFLIAAKAATILGTLQATYTQDLAYLSGVAKTLTEKDALLGVSITGIMDSPDVLLSPEVLKEGAEKAVEINKLWAKKLNINQAARVTCVKPEGTNSLILMSASGAHPHHSRKYFRRVQCNRNDSVYKYFKSVNPHMCEPGVWSANKTDEVITFPLQVSEKAVIKQDLTAVKHLELIRLIQQNWVLPGQVTGVNPTHNVSCTIQVADDEWGKVEEFLYTNKQYFAAVSLLSKIGDKLYKQAPMEDVTTEEDKLKWDQLVQHYKKLDYKKLKEEEDTTSLLETASCAGGKCEI